MLSIPQVTLAAQGVALWTGLGDCTVLGSHGRAESGGVHCPVHSGASHWEWAWKSLGPDREQCSRAEAGKASHAEPRLRRECQEEAAHKRGVLESPAWVKGQWPRSNRLLFPAGIGLLAARRLFQKGWVFDVETCYLQKSKNQPAKQKSFRSNRTCLVAVLGLPVCDPVSSPSSFQWKNPANSRNESSLFTREAYFPVLFTQNCCCQFSTSLLFSLLEHLITTRLVLTGSTKNKSFIDPFIHSTIIQQIYF